MKFSIITVCCNSATTIERTIQSVVAQNESGFEIEYIIIDGASTDGTLDIIKKYEKKENGVTFALISEPDQGIYDAMNKGVKHATGDVVEFINSDDWLMPHSLKTAADIFDLNQYDILLGATQMVRDGKPVAIKYPTKPDLSYYTRMPATHQSIFAKRELFDKIGDFDLSFKVCADYDWILRAYMYKARFVTTNRLLSCFSYGGASNSLLCSEERRTISLKYLPPVMRKEYIPEIERLYHESSLQILYQKAFVWIKCDPAHVLKFQQKLLSEGVPINRSWALFGGGVRASESCELLDMLHCPIKWIYDNNPQRAGKFFDGELKVYSPAKIDINLPILITTYLYETEVSRQLDQLRVKYYITMSELMQRAYDFALLCGMPPVEK